VIIFDRIGLNDPWNLRTVADTFNQNSGQSTARLMTSRSNFWAVRIDEPPNLDFKG